MIVLGWCLATISVAAGAAVTLWRPHGRDSVLVVIATLGVACWNILGSIYQVRPLPWQLSDLYLVSVYVAIVGWVMVARRSADRLWWPGRIVTALLLVEPVLLIAALGLSERTWGRLFWPEQPWHHEPLGIGFEAHSVWSMILLAFGAAAMIRRTEQSRGVDRYLSAAAVAAVSIGTGAQLTGVRIMPYTAFANLMIMLLIRWRENPDSVSAMAELAERDPVTGAMGRAGLDAVLQHAVELSRKQQMPLSVMVIDVDDFKGVNDHNGHVVGDMALRHVTSMVRETVGGIVGRFGGDEFVVVLPGMDVVAAHELAERVVGAVNRPFDAAGRETEVSVSVGVADYDSEAGGSVDELLIAADRAMYAAKRRGGGTATVS